MSGMDDLNDTLARLRAQLDEDERVARAAGGDAWAEDGNSVTSAALAQGDFSKRGYWVASASFSCEGETESLREGHAEHIARHDPARVLREVRVKRQLLEFLDPNDMPSGEGRYVAERVITLLALSLIRLADLISGGPVVPCRS